MDRRRPPAPPAPPPEVPFEAAPYDGTPNDPMSWSDYGANMLNSFGTANGLNRGMASMFGYDVPAMQERSDAFAKDYPVSSGAMGVLSYAPYAMGPGGVIGRAGIGALMEGGASSLRNFNETGDPTRGPENPPLNALSGAIAGGGGKHATDTAGKAAKGISDYFKRPPVPKGMNPRNMRKLQEKYRKIEQNLDLSKYAGKGKREIQRMLKEEGLPARNITKRAERVMKRLNNP